MTVTDLTQWESDVYGIPLFGGRRARWGPPMWSVAQLGPCDGGLLRLILCLPQVVTRGLSWVPGLGGL